MYFLPEVITLNRKRKKGLSFKGMFCLVICAIISSSSLMGFDKMAQLCIGLTIPSFDVNTALKSQIILADSSSDKDTTINSEKSQTFLNKSLAYIPDDIKKLIDKAHQNESNDKKDGSIVEHFYDKTSATTSYQNILVRNASDKSIDIKTVLSEAPDLKIKNKSEEPSILVFHTHTTESYQILDRNFYAVGYTSRNTNLSLNMVRVGNEIVSQLQNAGFKVIHDTNIYDMKYSGAYERSGAAIDEYLKKYPSIKVILDIHRDAIQDNSGTKTKPIATINGKKAAQIMIISGCEGDGVTGFPDWKYNLRFALQLQKKCNEMYPGLTRPLLFDNRRYNMYKSHNSLLIEVGSDSNTLDEATYSARLLGNVLSNLLENYT